MDPPIQPTIQPSNQRISISNKGKRGGKREKGQRTLTIKLARLQRLHDLHFAVPQAVVDTRLLREDCDLELPELLTGGLHDWEPQLLVPLRGLPALDVDFCLLRYACKVRNGNDFIFFFFFFWRGGGDVFVDVFCCQYKNFVRVFLQKRKSVIIISDRIVEKTRTIERNSRIGILLPERVFIDQVFRFQDHDDECSYLLSVSGRHDHG